MGSENAYGFSEKNQWAEGPTEGPKMGTDRSVNVNSLEAGF